jgi:FtsP/CotA-like multicopper oxidase with cupredoxin domain
VGEWIAIDYFNEGLQIHPMHLHGFDQIVVAKDGRALNQPYLVDTLNVAPGERYTVIVNPTLPGVWAYHCHILTHAEGPNGMFGMVTALIVEA